MTIETSKIGKTGYFIKIFPIFCIDLKNIRNKYFSISNFLSVNKFTQIHFH